MEKFSKAYYDKKMAEITEKYGELIATTCRREDGLGQCTDCIVWAIGEEIEKNVSCVCEKINADNFQGDVDHCLKTGRYFDKLLDMKSKEELKKTLGRV